jgi:hypothetical protein
MVSEEELFSTADILSVHLRRSAMSRQFVNATRLAPMKPSALLVDISWAGIVDRKALAASLRSGRLAGVALDLCDDGPVDMHDPIANGRVLPTVCSRTRGQCSCVYQRDPGEHLECWRFQESAPRRATLLSTTCYLKIIRLSWRFRPILRAPAERCVSPLGFKAAGFSGVY